MSSLSPVCIHLLLHRMRYGLLTNDLQQPGLTKDLAYRKQQLQNMCRFIEENIEELQKVIYDDLHKHKLEAAIGEILAVSDECKYMVKVCICAMMLYILHVLLIFDPLEPQSTFQAKGNPQTIHDQCC